MKRDLNLKPKFVFGAIAPVLVSHLALAPILAIYGVHICPVLGVHGFLFGCKFNLIYIWACLILSSVLNVVLFRELSFRTLAKKSTFTLRDFSFFAAVIHASTFFIGLIVLNDYLESLELPGPSLTRMVAAFSISIIFLSLLTAEVFSFAIQKWLREASLWADLENTTEAKSGAIQVWLRTEIARATPYLALFAVSVVYFMSKVDEASELYEIDTDFIQSRGTEAIKILGLAGLWLLAIQTLKLLKDRNLLKDVSVHVEKISSGSTDYFTREIESGVWSDLFRFLNQTTRAMAQRKRLIKGLSNYAAEQVVEHVLHKDELHTQSYRRRMAILMSDLRGFTEMSNSLDPETVVKILNLYFEAMIDVCTNNGLIVDKFIGDGLLAYVDGHEAGSTEETCRRALQAAKDMIARLESLNAHLKTLGFRSLEIGIGIHHGDVVVGSIGSSGRLQHTIIGDAVNTAARLEAQCKSLKTCLVVSSSVVQNSPEAFKDLKYHGEIEIRGISRPVSVHILPAEKSDKIAA